MGLATILALAGTRTADAADHGFRLQTYGGWGGHRHGHYHGGGRVWRSYGRPWGGSVYHGPSVHYDPVWHHEYNHWTPRRGWHSHGHFDAVPHYVPGHFDYHHFDHIDPNPWYHH
jgi:hypothetical protein